MPKNLIEPAKSSRLTVLRRIIQLGMLTLLGQWSYYGIFRCPFPVPYVSCTNCPVIACPGASATFFWGTWLAIPLSVIVFGRAFCGWACPGGLVVQLTGMLAPFKVRVKNMVNAVAPSGKYLGLMAGLYLWLVLENPRWMVPIRVGEFWNSLTLSFEHAGTLWLVRTFLVFAFVVLGFGLANVWCRYACPTGGLLEVLKRFSWFRVYKTEACNDCNKCLAVCEMGTRPAEVNCTNCGDCLKSCPVQAIAVGRKR
ncbi:MAG TPA: 4Fe-4S binding protein [Thermodesulfobacteriota bacterium]|nr:4Fe-4S binding protein [Thermodesulfobacteriota bacterium]HQO79379.1 4Fe-4S binding protein [Thermodesulfobacteriota bacterium]